MEPDDAVTDGENGGAFSKVSVSSLQLVASTLLTSSPSQCAVRE
jgi:hypothetical protein